eukprot:5597292-Amphidinium_carterae.1
MSAAYCHQLSSTVTRYINFYHMTDPQPLTMHRNPHHTHFDSTQRSAAHLPQQRQRHDYNSESILMNIDHVLIAVTTLSPLTVNDQLTPHITLFIITTFRLHTLTNFTNSIAATTLLHCIGSNESQPHVHVIVLAHIIISHYHIYMALGTGPE